MKKLEELRRDADAQREVFFRQLAEAPKILRPSRLLDAALAAFDPEFKALDRMKVRASRNPFGLLAAVAGLVLLARQVTSKRSGEGPEKERPVRRSRFAPANTKGDDHGNHVSPKQ
jgi:hypothetical protein